MIRTQYKVKLVKKDVSPIAIFCLDSRTKNYGFADRLRGMVSCYAYAKAVGIPFRIEHINPFDLSKYFVPNSYDWLLKTGEKSNNLLYANPVCFFDNTKSSRQDDINHLFKINNKRQHHLYTNYYFLNDVNDRYKKNYVFGDLFSELFKPSLLLEKMICEQKARIGGRYISVSFRFAQLMGDFKDCVGEELSKEDKTVLLEKSLSVVRSLFEQNQKTILVTSDSQTFIDAVSKLDFVYVVPGKIGHIGYLQGCEIVEKMLLDFYLISQADHVYSAQSGEMYGGAFAEFAAMSNNTPYTTITY